MRGRWPERGPRGKGVVRRRVTTGVRTGRPDRRWRHTRRVNEPPGRPYPESPGHPEPRYRSYPPRRPGRQDHWENEGSVTGRLEGDVRPAPEAPGPDPVTLPGPPTPDAVASEARWFPVPLRVGPVTRRCGARPEAGLGSGRSRRTLVRRKRSTDPLPQSVPIWEPDGPSVFHRSTPEGVGEPKTYPDPGDSSRNRGVE